MFGNIRIDMPENDDINIDLEHHTRNIVNDPSHMKHSIINNKCTTVYSSFFIVDSSTKMISFHEKRGYHSASL